MSSLVELYKNYYREQTRESIAYLFEGMLEYDYRNYWEDMKRVAIMHSQTMFTGDCFTLYTNGSTNGISKKYEFGPHFDVWVGIERFLRKMDDGITIFLASRLGNGKPPNKLMFERLSFPHNKKHFETNANFLDDEQIEDLFSHVTKIHEEGHKINFSSFPDVWNMLFSNPKFNELCLEHKDKIGCLINNDFEMFLTTDKFYVRDQMINWVSGANFFVCEHGTKHFLPTFYPGKTCLNLINLRKKHDGSDRVVVDNKEPILCECGKPYLPMEILFHKDNSILNTDGKCMDFAPLKKTFNGRYAIIQFHQNDNQEITIFLSTIGKIDEDLDKIKSFFCGLKTEFRFDRYFEVGSKRYCFWRSNFIEEREFKLN